MGKLKKKNVFLKSAVRNGFFQLFLFTLIPFVVYVISQRRISGFFEHIGLYIPNSMISFLIVILSMFILTIVINKLRDIILPSHSIEEYDDHCISSSFRENGFSTETMIALLFTALITTGLSEEILFRGFVAKGLINSFGFQIGNIIQAMIFSSLHGIPLYLKSKKVSISLFEFTRVFVIAYAFGWLMVFVCGGSILPLWIRHGLGNVIAFYNKAFKRKTLNSIENEVA